jgi:16S rRNA (adenine1518-N6/adenine1519-N6)-dimethyltransferase
VKRRRRLGQHLLKDSEVLNQIVGAAHISVDSIVFEIGTGEGDLTEILCRCAGQVISTEIDRDMFETAALRLSDYRNLELILGDGFSVNRFFNVLVSNIPYSKSRRFVEWLVERRQKEFGDKLLAEPGAANYRAVTVVAQAFFQVTRLFNVGREAFSPPPQVDSTVLLLQPRGDAPIDLQLVSSLKTLFSFRGRQVSSAAKHIFKDEEALQRFHEHFGDELFRKRVEHLTVDEAVNIAKTLMVKSTG